VSPVSPEERERIAEALRSGMSQNAVARAMGRGPATVNRIAAECGLEYSAPKNARVGLEDFCIERRQRLLNAAFAKAEELLEGVDRPSQLMQWSIAFGTLKRRLEDGDVTSRTEVSSSDDTRTRLASRLDELATRRAAKDAAERAVG
jgi:hypothetical protein